MHTLPALVLASIGAFRAGDGAAPLQAPALTIGSQPEPDPVAPEPVRHAYGDRGGWFWTSGGGTAPDFDRAYSSNVHLAISHFIAPKFEIGGEAAVWYFDQPGDNAGGISGTLLLRYHLIMTEEWTVFADAGVGVLGCTDDVPDGGSSLNLLPRVGGGVTRELTDDGLRLMLGARWHHISNARINGDDENPARDGAMFYLAFVWPF